jgi:hypothetical protein
MLQKKLELGNRLSKIGTSHISVKSSKFWDLVKLSLLTSFGRGIIIVVIVEVILPMTNHVNSTIKKLD